MNEIELMLSHRGLKEKIEHILGFYFLVAWWRINDNPVVTPEGIDRLYDRVVQLLASWGLDKLAIEGYLEIMGELWMTDYCAKERSVQPEDDEYKNAYNILIQILNYYEEC